MWRTVERRFARHVCLRHPFRPFLFELLATVGWKWGCQPFSCRCSQNVMHCRKEICWRCLSKESIPAIPFWNSKHPLSTRSSSFLRATVRSAISALNYGCIMPIPSFQLRKKPVLCTEVIVSKIWITGYRLHSQLWHVTPANQWTIMNHCWDWAFSNSGLEVLPPAFQLPMFAKRDALPKGDLFDMLVKGNPCLLWNLSLQSLPEAWGPWERQQAPPALQHACIMVAKDIIQYLHYRLLIVISVVLNSDCFKSTKSCWDWACSNSGLEAGLPAFQLPMFAKCDALKEICSTCAEESMPFVKSKPPLPTRSLRSLRAAARSTSSAACLHHACKK